MKDLILVTAFCPTKEKEDKLRDFLSFIRNYDNLFDVMVSSHSNLSSDIVDMCDYYIFDKENLLLTDDEYRQSMWFTNSIFSIKSNYVMSFSTSYAVLKLTSLGIIMANSLGYKKIHKLEYDTKITSIIEFTKNSNLLNQNDVILYSKNGSMNETMVGSLWSANIDKLPKIYFSYIKKDVFEFLQKKQGNALEREIQNKFSQMKYVCKNINDLKYNGIEVDLFRRGFWAVPIYDSRNNKIIFFTYNDSKKENLDVILKFSDNIRNIKLTKQNEWNVSILNDFEKINLLTVWVDNKMVLDIDFSKINIDSFKKSNHIIYK
jgi:hypothetical protein